MTTDRRQYLKTWSDEKFQIGIRERKASEHESRVFGHHRACKKVITYLEDTWRFENNFFFFSNNN